MEQKDFLDRFLDSLATDESSKSDAPVGSDGQAESKKPDIQWNDRAEPTQRGNKKTYTTNGPIRIDRWSHSLGFDGIRYNVHWHPLGADGKRVLEKPEESISDKGGHTGATGILKGIFGVEPPNNVFEPPRDNSHGWEVEIEVPPSESMHGNSLGAYLEVFLGKRKKP